MESALDLCNPKTLKSLENYLGESLNSLNEIKNGLRKLIEKYRKKGAVGIKLAHAYERTLFSEKVSYEEASIIYYRFLKGNKLNSKEKIRLQDHIIFYLADLCEELGLVFQIHTGVQKTWANITDSNPLHLIPLILSHPKVRFDLLHAGYPYSREIGMLGKHYPNVWLNMAWMYIVTMEGSRQSLSEWIDLVPGDRILGFGSDVLLPETIYSHLLMARSCIADVLTKKVKRDFLSKEVAFDLVHKILKENPTELYSLKK
jgi:predicted TIM-barrel fold metal-dependent hydrolase